MATGYSCTSSQLSHGGCVGDEGRLTRSLPGPRTLREIDHDSTQHAQGRLSLSNDGDKCAMVTVIFGIGLFLGGGIN